VTGGAILSAAIFRVLAHRLAWKPAVETFKSASSFRRMTIGIEELRPDKGGDVERVKESERKRFRDGKVVDEVIELDKQWIKAQFNTEQKRKEVGVVQKSITERKKADKNAACDDLLKDKASLEEEIVQLVKVSDELLEKRDEQLGKIGNLVPDDGSVPLSKNEDDNRVVSKWGVPRKFDAKYGTNGFRPHFELLEMIGAVDFDAGRDVAGERAYFLTGPGVLLNQALLNYGIAFLSMKGYTPVQPPFFMKKDLMAKTAELDDYDDVLYKVVEDPKKPELDKYLIATSEQPLSALHRAQNLDQGRFPLRYAGISSCFRREAGSSGRDIRGIFRVHQFEKIEQFVFSAPDKSWEEHEMMIRMAEEFWQSLGVPYHSVSIVSGVINNAAAKKYDLEGWFPCDNEGNGQYRELVSCSNCTDYQARAMGTKYGFKPTDPYAHFLNSTLCATERGLCCLVENYQEADGVRVPRALVPFMLGKEFLPFVKTLKEEKKTDKKQEKKPDKKQEKEQPKQDKTDAKEAGSPKGSPKAAPASSPKKGEKSPKASPKAAPAAPAGNEDIAAKVLAVGDELRILKEKLKGDGLSGKKLNEHPEVKAKVAELQELKAKA
jgi:seryl-tRNA synthetase